MRFVRPDSQSDAGHSLMSSALYAIIHRALAAEVVREVLGVAAAAVVTGVRLMPPREPFGEETLDLVVREHRPDEVQRPILVRFGIVEGVEKGADRAGYVVSRFRAESPLEVVARQHGFSSYHCSPFGAFCTL